MVCVLRTHVRCAPLLPAVGTGRPTDTLDEKNAGAAFQSGVVPLQACGPREPHPRQVDILLNNGMAVTCVKYNGRPQHLHKPLPRETEAVTA